MYALGAAAGEPCSFCPINSRGGQAAGEAACESCIEDFSTAEQRSERATRTVVQTDQGGGKNTLPQEDEQTFVADARVMCVDADEVRMDSSPAQGQRGLIQRVPTFKRRICHARVWGAAMQELRTA